MNKKIVLSIVLLAILTITSVAFLNPVRADSVTVLSSSSFTDSIGAYHIVGEVQNTGSSTVDYVQITATYYDSSNKIVDTQFTFASLSYMQPNAKSPFDIIETTTTLVPQISTYKLQVSSTASGSIQQGLVITQNNQHTDTIGALHIVGEIQNTGSSTSSATEIIATCYDSSGKVVDTGFTFANPEDVQAGSTNPFEIIITDTTQVPLIANYVLTAQSSDYALVSASSATPTATPTATQTSQTSNPTSTPVTPEFPTTAILAIFLVLSLFAVIMLTARKRKISSAFKG